MRKRAIYFFIALLLLPLGLTSIPNASSQTQNIKIVSYSYYIDSIGVLDVVGVVQNVGANTVSSVYLTGTAYSLDGTDQGDSNAKVWVSYLTPQQKAPFYMEFHKPSSSSSDWLSVGVSKVTLAVSEANATSLYQYPDLKITSSSAKVSSNTADLGTYWVSGSIQNTGSQTASKLTVVGIFYNSTGTAVAVGYTAFLTPTSLSPSATTSFQIGAFDLNQSVVSSNQKISSYSLLVQAQTPILNGTAPIATSTPSGQDVTSNDSLNSTLGYVTVIAIVLAAIAGTVLALRKRKHPPVPVKEAKKAPKKRMVEI